MTDGACRCGQLRFRVTGTPLMTMACHCTGCQKMSASAFSLSTFYPARAFTVIAGQPVIGGLHGGTRHFFCGHCLSWAYTQPEGMDDFVNVRSTLLQDAADYRPFIETFTADKLAWAETGAKHSFKRFPPSDAFAALMAAFAI
ncbi:GFA family protein [Sphingomonas sp. 28-63-12]|uniref:GFA family protein n=1 Tax=Sphingomonas sp. 28-63-12 TaxID=1970434 RepID=UPI000BD48E2C|nr:MAG: aldehyde-activating protein [Sphingomonas sp. 28-63-12]